MFRLLSLQAEQLLVWNNGIAWTLRSSKSFWEKTAGMVVINTALHSGRKTNSKLWKEVLKKSEKYHRIVISLRRNSEENEVFQ